MYICTVKRLPQNSTQITHPAHLPDTNFSAVGYIDLCKLGTCTKLHYKLSLATAKYAFQFSSFATALHVDLNYLSGIDKSCNM